MSLRMPKTYADASEAEREAKTNGCGPAGLERYVPDHLLGLSIVEACKIHDWEYGEGATQADRKAADDRFLLNMRTLIDAEGGFFIRAARRFLAWWYWRAVRRYGSDAFIRRL